MLVRCACVLGATWSAVGCSRDLPPPESPSPNTFSFAVFGDGPYSQREVGPYISMWEDARANGVAWLIHVGDILSGSCGDAVLQARYRDFAAAPFPVVYTPGDNEWTDCHKKPHGSFDPLERLARIRSIFFQDSARRDRLDGLVCQCADPVWSHFPEHVRWKRGGFIFATLHVVGSANATEDFKARSARDDSAATHRMAAVASWIDSTFAVARRDSASGIVFAFHGNPGFERERQRPAYRAFVERLRDSTLALGRPVLAIHGDTHTQHMDHPLTDPATGRPIELFTRLETFGSPAIGWVRVEIDSVRGRIARITPRLLSSSVPW